MKKFSMILLIAAFVSIFIISCKEDDDDNNQVNHPFDNGIFISNEGPFQAGSGTVSFLDKNNLQISNGIFEDVNDRPLGNIVQSVSVHNNKVFIVVNNANKIEVVDQNTFKSVGSISNLELPRHFLGINNNKAYVSQWGSTGMTGTIKVIDLSDYSVRKTINTGSGAEKMVLNNGKVYLVNNGGFGYDSTLKIIDTNTDSVIQSITVGPNPNSLQLDKNGDLWVLCSGKWNSGWTELEYKGKLVKVDLGTNTVTTSMEFSSLYSTPGQLTINKSMDKLYYLYSGGIYEHDINSSALNTSAFINKNAYGLGVNPEDDIIYVADPKDYVSNGMVFRYNSTGSVIDSFEVGITPNGFAF